MRKLNFRCWGLFLLCALSYLGAKEAIDIKLLKSAPQIDADLSKQAWQDIPWRSGFTLLNQSTIKAPQETRFKVGHDNFSLYFLIEAKESTPDKLKAEHSGRDARLWNDDCVELFVDPNSDRDRFYQFVINSKGEVFDSEYLQGGILSSSSWNSQGLEVATKVTVDSFIVELSVPLVDLGLERIDGQLSFNVARESYTSDNPVRSSFSPINGGFLQSAYFAVAQLENCSLQHFAWKIRSPYDCRIIMRGEELFYEGKVFLRNETGILRLGSLEMSFTPEKTGFRENVILDDSLGREYAFALPVDTSVSSQILLLEIRDGKTAELGARRQIPVSIRYSPLVVELENPPYRDNIYSDMDISEISGKIGIHTADAETLAVEIKFCAPGGAVIAAGSRQGPGEFILPIPKLADASYLLTVTAGTYKAEKTIKKLPRLAGEIRFDKNNVMYVDGKRSIPYGWFSTTDLPFAAESGFNLNFDYCGAYYHGEKLREVFDLYAAHGIKAAIYCYPSSTLYSAAAQRQPLSPKEAEQIRGRIRELRQHPALLGWYICDEPEGAPALPARMKEVYEICKEEDPHHPAIILNNTVSGYQKYAESGDIIMPDIYPNFIAGGGAGKPIIDVFNKMQAASEVNARINWCTPQAFNYADYGRQGQRPPNFTELRNMQYQALLAGTTGMCWYIYAHNDCYPEVLLGAAQLLKEAKILQEIWFARHKRIMLSCESAEIIAANYPKLADGLDLLVVVNTSINEQKFSLPAAEKEYFAVGEKKTFRTIDGRLSDVLEKYQSRVYASDQGLADSFSLDEYKPRLEAAQKALHKEGNLAYTPAGGVEFEVSWKSNYPSWHLGDGAFVMNFRPDNKEKKNAAVLIKFSEETKASQLILYGQKLEKASVEVEQDGEWVKIADLEKIDDGKMLAEWTAMKCRKLRLGNMRFGAISEVEVY